jgi:BirA family biotin operon repressor/biotin-[acetyl-CoA-carboxylase] ligase
MFEDKISPEAVVKDLKTRFIGQKIIHYPTLNSTMEAAKREAIWGAEAGTVIVADEQTTGRGRSQHIWLSPAGSLSLSVILRPNLDNLPYMVMLTSVAVTYGIQLVTGLKPQIKWPNDILIKEKKVCGILIENDIRRNSLKHTIIGIGINVNLRLKDHPEIAPIATSLSDELGVEVPRVNILRQLLTEMDRLYQSLAQGDFVLEQWKKHLGTLGQKVQVNQGDQVYRGTAESVNRDGSLMLRQDNGSLIKIIAGDVYLG